MLKSKAEISESRYLGGISSSVSPFKSLFPKSKQNMNSTRRAKSKSNSENIAPPDSNIQISDPPLSGSISFPKKSPTKPLVNTNKVEDTTSVLPEAPDTTVKVVVRLRPTNCRGGGFQTVTKVSNDSVSVGERKFTLDAVFDSNSTQEEVYQLVGAPLVKDALSGYNTSLLAYGQTGSGKTYTMWGPPSAMVEGPSASGLQGIVPRIFQSLFYEIQKEQENSDGKQINYQCRCSFLEIYNEKIGDLLDPTQRNLQIKDDAKNGFYVENLTEEYVTSYEDVIQILIKGLSSRKVGTTSINSKSSRSHIVFTFIIESWCKESSSKCFGSSKTSRISMVDLAGFERILLDDAGRQYLKEGKYIKKSTSQLGHLVNILAERSNFGRAEDVPYKSSCLTHVLRESFGGNAKLSIICSISPDSRSNGETISTLRFGQRAKLVKNEPVINEITEDDVDDLSNQIRQLKEELIKAKSNSCNSFISNQGYFRGQSVRESVNQLRLSLNRSLILPCVDNDSEKEISVNEDDVKELRFQIDNLLSSHEENFENRDCNQLYSAEGCETEQACEHYLSCSEESECEEISSRVSQTEFPDLNNPASVGDPDGNPKKSMAIDPPLRSSLSISGCLQPAVLQDPLFSESPKISTQRKSTVFSSNHLSNQDVVTSKNLDVGQSNQNHDHIKSSLRSSRIFPGQTESLAASLNRGLQIIDHQQGNSASTRSLASFSFEHFALKPHPSAEKAYASVQTSPCDKQSSDAPFASFVCMKCQGRETSASNEVKDSVNSWMVPVDGSGSFNRLATQVTRLDVEKDLAMAIKREKELDNICKEQAAKIEHLNQLLEQYNCETYKNSINENKNEKCPSSINENKLLAWDVHENHEPEFIKEKCEIKEVQEELNRGKDSFDVEEREALLKEIEILRSKLQSYTATPTNRSVDRLRSSLLSQSIQLRRSSACSRGNNSEEEFEKERQKWMEMESDWILLTDELRIDLESNRQRAERVEMELRLEKNCTEELDDAIKRAVIGHARLVEHYADLQEKYNDLEGKYRTIMEGIAEVKMAAAKAGAKGCGSRFAKSLAVELSALRMERERERKLLKKENQRLRIQLKDTAEAVHAAGELLARLREAEEATSVAEEKNTMIQEENENLKKQIEKLKSKHKMEITTMKQYLAESRLPQAALQPPLCREDSDVIHQDTNPMPDDDQSWRAEFGATYQEHY
ncbi:Kinesin motor family protein [Forsythia ovata]